MRTKSKWHGIMFPGLLLALTAAAAPVSTIHLRQFSRPHVPTSGLTQITGGDYVTGMQGPNTITRFNQKGTPSALYVFASDGSEGIGPGPLLQASDGNLYGTCYAGGVNHAGTIFKVTLNGEFTLLYTFQGLDGNGPSGKLVEGNGGALYGVTQFGGTQDAGTVFRVSPTGVFTSLYTLNGTTEGYNMNGGLILASDGNFWGTTFAGGSNPSGAGTVFKISPQGNFTSVYSFDGPNGYFPLGPVLQRSDGNFYGTTTFGGRWDFGVVYRLTPTGEYTVLASFDDSSNGADPFGALIEGSDGNLYGITDQEYYFLGGTAFRLSSTNKLTTLAAFGEGDEVFDGLIQAEGGGIRGTTDSTMFTIHLGIPEPKPSITGFEPARGKPGTVVTIRGDHFVYAGQVMFNGVAAQFQTTSANFILAVVPNGASTGPVTIRNVGGASSSNFNFTVE